jgi:hypothetical protein
LDSSIYIYTFDRIGFSIMPPKYATPEDLKKLDEKFDSFSREVREGQVRMEKTLDEMKMLLFGNPQLGIQSFADRQRANEEFKKEVAKQFEEIEKKIELTIEEKLEPMVEWKGKVETIVGLITSPKFWAIVIGIMGAIVTTGIWVALNLKH